MWTTLFERRPDNEGYRYRAVTKCNPGHLITSQIAPGGFNHVSFSISQAILPPQQVHMPRRIASPYVKITAEKRAAALDSAGYIVR